LLLVEQTFLSVLIGCTDPIKDRADEYIRPTQAGMPVPPNWPTTDL